MTRHSSILVAGLAVLAFSSLPLRSTVLDAETAALCAAVEPKVVEWRRDFHQHPELSNREFKTAAKIASHLQSLGLSVVAG